MGRRRKDGNPLGLEPRVYWHHGQFIYRHRDGTPEKLGKDVAKANERAKLYNSPKRDFGTVAYFLELYLADARAGRLLKRKKARTIADNEIEAQKLKAALGAYFPHQLVEDPSLIADYRKSRTARVRANRELSLLSAMFTWLIERGDAPGVMTNPLREIQRNPETPKERYVEDHEYATVYGIAVRPVCMAMVLAYRTLQRPEDLLTLGPQNIRTKTVGGVATRVISLVQGKTDRPLDIAITADIEDALGMLAADGTVRSHARTLIHRHSNARDARQGFARYTVDGIGSMLRRYCDKSAAFGVRSFGLMDIRAKGATDMYLSGVSLEKIQRLMGHKSVQTTEIYIKRLLQTISIADPNPLKVG